MKRNKKIKALIITILAVILTASVWIPDTSMDLNAFAATDPAAGTATDNAAAPGTAAVTDPAAHGGTASESEEEVKEVTGIVTSVENLSKGIRVTWSTDETKSGYIIYRKEGSKSSPWVKVRKITNPSRTRWLDKSVVNGRRYVYRVRSFDQSGITKSKEYKVIRRLNRPEIKKIKGMDINRIHIRGSRNTKATGYEIKYSLNKDFTNSKIIEVTGNRVDTDITKLKAGTRYYFRIRTFVVKGASKYYSNWSMWRSVVTKPPYDAYTTSNWTYLYKKASASSGFVKVWYNSEIRILGYAKERATGDWLKVNYSGKKYYLWVPKGAELFTRTRNNYDYVKDSNSDYENAVIGKALDCLKNWNMTYDYTHRAAHGVPDSNGNYPFDCSNFAAYVLNSVMQQYCPAYMLSNSVLVQSQMDAFINDGLKGEFPVTTLCDGKLDRSVLRPGDLLFFKTDPSDDRVVDHVGIFLGGDEIIHSVKNYERYPGDTKGGVAVAPLKGYNESTFLYAIRVIPEKFETADRVMAATGKVNIYPNVRCKTGTKIDSIQKGTEVTVLYTLNREYPDTEGDISSVVNAYVSYGDGKYGFIYEYEEKLEDVK